MNEFKFINSSKQLSDADFKLVEKEINMKLPPDLVSVYKKYNGGEIDGDRIIFKTATGEKYELECFHPMIYHRDDPDPLVEEMYEFLAVRYKTIPIDYIPFAMSPLGMRYCINVNNQKIYADNDENASKQIMNFICDSIYEFIDGMRKPEPGEQTIRDLFTKESEPTTRRKINIKAEFKFIDSAEQLSDADFKFVEQKIGVKLPQDLISVYRKYNGGIIPGDRNVFVSMNEDEIPYSLTCFHSMRYRCYGNQLLEEAYEFYVIKRKLAPFNYIPFATGDGGMREYYINIDTQKIYTYSSDINQYYETELILICNSIYEFINGMMTEDEADAI